IFTNLGLSPAKIEMLASWMLNLNYEFPKFSKAQNFLECCQKLKVLEGHNGCMFTFPAAELAVSHSKNNQEAIKILVRASLAAKLNKNKIIGAAQIKKFLLWEEIFFNCLLNILISP